MKKILFFLFAIAIVSGVQAQNTLILDRNSVKIDGGKEYTKTNDSLVYIGTDDTALQINKIQLGNTIKDGKYHRIKIEQKARNFVYVPNGNTGIKSHLDTNADTNWFTFSEQTHIYIDDTLRYIISQKATESTSSTPSIPEGKTTLTFFKDSLRLTTPDTVFTLFPKGFIYELPVDSLNVEWLAIKKLNEKKAHNVKICRKDSANSVLFEEKDFQKEGACNFGITPNDIVVISIDGKSYTMVTPSAKTAKNKGALWVMILGLLLLLGVVAATQLGHIEGQTNKGEENDTQNDSSNQEDKPTKNILQVATEENNEEENESNDKKEGEEQKSVENEKKLDEDSQKEGEEAGDAEVASQQEQKKDNTTDTEKPKEDEKPEDETTPTDNSELTKTISKLSISELLNLLSDKQRKELKDKSVGVWLGQTSTDGLYEKLDNEQRKELRGRVLHDKDTINKVLEDTDITILSNALKSKLLKEKCELSDDLYNFVLAKLRGDGGATKKIRINFIKDYFERSGICPEEWKAVVERIKRDSNSKELALNVAEGVFSSDDKTFRDFIANEIANSVNNQSLVLPREWDDLLEYLKQQTCQQNEDNKSQGGSTAPVVIQQPTPPENNSNDLTINQLENENAELRTANDQLEKEKKELNDKLTKTIEQRDEAIEQRDKAIKERDDFESEKKALNSMNVELKGKLEQKDQKLADTQEKLNAAKNKLTETEGKLTKANTTLIDTQSKLRTTNDVLVATQEKLRTTKDTLQKTEEDLGSANKQITEWIRQWVASMNGLRDELASLVPKGILDNSKQLYSGSHDVMTDMVDMILTGRNNLKKFIDRFEGIKVDQNTTSADIKQDIQKMILEELGGQNPGWIDILMRLYAYTKVYFLRDELARLGLHVDFVTTAAEHTLALMGQVGIYAEIPNLFVTAYDKSTYDLEPLKTIDQIVPSVSDHAVSGVVADIYRIGYHTDNPVKHKNAIVSIY